MGDNNKSGVESQQTGTVYLLTCTVNGKQYVGQTRQKLSQRIYKHRYESKRGRPGVDAAIHKHGWEKFTVEVLETCHVEKLDEREIFWIRELNTRAPHGYNLTDGGDGCTGYKHTAESRSKMSANHADVSGEKNPQYGKHPSEETKAKISANHADVSGEKNPNYGKHPSEETKAKMSDAHKGKKFGPRSPESKAKSSAALKAAWARRKKALENGGDK